ncbi:response regulator transcription factor [Streptomyces sp. W16]|uniref:response regulator transcription factor n=1 Tax=Streptomyces sp. W16 TaxID=3076631 RepID=UPI00295C1A22|nr:response regulator transcription factor [Streptomyces sp. W16]MDV9170863.1 response regulator transcription factor [Streptomyces sp. W16]
MSLEDDFFGVGQAAEGTMRVLVADHDPISRHVLTRVLHRSTRFDVVGSVNDHQELHDWPLDRVDVVVLASTQRDDVTGLVRHLDSRKVPTLLIATAWSKQRIDEAFAAGAAGCLEKNIDVAGLSAAIFAVGSGHTVISTELRSHYAEWRPSTPGRDMSADMRLPHTLTSREQEVLRCLAEGMSTAETAARLRVSPATVKSHVSHSLTKLGARNRLEAVLLFQRRSEPDAETTSLGRTSSMAG